MEWFFTEAQIQEISFEIYLSFYIYNQNKKIASFPNLIEDHIRKRCYSSPKWMHIRRQKQI